MSREDIIRKLTSRRLWVSIASFVSMLIVALGHSESEATQITSLILAGASVLGYVIGEGLVDAAAATTEPVTAGHSTESGPAGTEPAPAEAEPAPADSDS